MENSMSEINQFCGVKCATFFDVIRGDLIKDNCQDV